MSRKFEMQGLEERIAPTSLPLGIVDNLLSGLTSSGVDASAATNVGASVSAAGSSVGADVAAATHVAASAAGISADVGLGVSANAGVGGLNLGSIL